MAVRNPDDGGKQTDSYNVVVGVDSVDRGLSRINLVSYYSWNCSRARFYQQRIQINATILSCPVTITAIEFKWLLHV